MGAQTANTLQQLPSSLMGKTGQGQIPIYNAQIHYDSIVFYTHIYIIIYYFIYPAGSLLTGYVSSLESRCFVNAIDSCFGQARRWKKDVWICALVYTLLYALTFPMFSPFPTRGLLWQLEKWLGDWKGISNCASVLLALPQPRSIPPFSWVCLDRGPRA